LDSREHWSCRREAPPAQKPTRTWRRDLEDFKNLVLGLPAAGAGLWEHRRMFLSFAYFVFSAVLRLLVGSRRSDYDELMPQDEQLDARRTVLGETRRASFCS
jgi:hypothetical protein